MSLCTVVVRRMAFNLASRSVGRISVLESVTSSSKVTEGGVSEGACQTGPSRSTASEQRSNRSPIELFSDGSSR
jgi:uncharacterized low-complexity protein